MSAVFPEPADLRVVPEALVADLAARHGGTFARLLHDCAEMRRCGGVPQIFWSASQCALCLYDAREIN